MQIPGFNRNKSVADLEKAIGISKDPIEVSAEAVSAKTEVTFIDRYDLLPKGESIDLTKIKRPMQKWEADNFAAIVTSTRFCYLLYEANGVTRPMMEVHSRLLFEGYNVIPLQTTKEVIRAVQDHDGRTHADIISETEIERFTLDILKDADGKETSDIHIETRGTSADIYYRVHGKRLQQSSWSHDRVIAFANHLYNWLSDDKARGTSWNKDAIQDTRMTKNLGNSGNSRILNIRFHSAPIHPDGNVQIVMRLLRQADSGGLARPLDEVGFSDNTLDEIKEMVGGGSGLVLVVGPTNSGKSTSLQTFASHVRKVRGETIKISTIENPVEYEMLGACQHPATEETFNDFLKATLRQDPDVVVVGEIRGSEAASMIKDITLAGHKIFSTLHVYEAPAAISRLIELGVPRSLLAMPGFLSGVIFQGLVPVLCKHCSVDLKTMYEQKAIEPDLLDRIMRVITPGVDDVRFIKEGGCEKCNFLGVVGRTPCAEVLRPDERYLQYVREGNDAAAKDYWLKQLGKRAPRGGPTALSHALSKMRLGQLDPRDIEAKINPLSDEKFYGQ